MSPNIQNIAAIIRGALAELRLEANTRVMVEMELADVLALRANFLSCKSPYACARHLLEYLSLLSPNDRYTLEELIQRREADDVRRAKRRLVLLNILTVLTIIALKAEFLSYQEIGLLSSADLFGLLPYGAQMFSLRAYLAMAVEKLPRQPLRAKMKGYLKIGYQYTPRLNLGLSGLLLASNLLIMHLGYMPAMVNFRIELTPDTYRLLDQPFIIDFQNVHEGIMRSSARGFKLSRIETVPASLMARKWENPQIRIERIKTPAGEILPLKIQDCRQGESKPDLLTYEVTVYETNS